MKTMATSFTIIILLNIFSVLAQKRGYDCVQPKLCDDERDISMNPRMRIPRQIIVGCPTGYVSCQKSKCGATEITQEGEFGLATPGAFPWQAYLEGSTEEESKYIGSGVLIDQYHVLTAAHKVTNVSSVNVIMGVYNTSDFTKTQSSIVDSILIHSEYQNDVLKNDVALLELSTPIDFGENIGKICLSNKSYIGEKCVVSGWGQTTFAVDDAPTRIQKFVYVPIVTAQECIASYGRPDVLGPNVNKFLDTDYEICAGGEPDKDACTQDGGSPLVCKDEDKYFVAGLVIWGKNCGRANVFGTYVSVPAYLDWINCALQCFDDPDTCECPVLLQV